jgi:hypothetical protein
MTPQPDQKQTLARVLDRANGDPAFKQKLLADMAGTLKAEGVNIPLELSEADLEHIAGGKRDLQGTFDDAFDDAVNMRRLDALWPQLQGLIGGNKRD